jgi:hypothetical protein
MKRPRDEEQPGPMQPKFVNSNPEKTVHELTSVGPKYDRIFVGIISAFEEIEEQVPSFDVNVSRVSTLK